MGLILHIISGKVAIIRGFAIEKGLPDLAALRCGIVHGGLWSLALFSAQKGPSISYSWQ